MASAWGSTCAGWWPRRLRLRLSTLAAAVLAAASFPTQAIVDLGDIRPIIVAGPGTGDRRHGVATVVGTRTWLTTAHTVRGLPAVRVGSRLERRVWTHAGLDAALIGHRAWRVPCHAPAGGEPILLHTFPVGRHGRRTYTGRVVSVAGNRVRFALDADPIPGWSGAPVTTPAGGLVGILVGRERGTNVLAASRCDAIESAMRERRGYWHE